MPLHSIVIAPSVLACDFGRIHEEVRRAEAAGADWLHMDVMDGHFVDNISFGPAVVASVHEIATRPLDVHLMITRPDHYLARFTGIAKNITVHVESDHDVLETLKAIRTAGCTCGLSLRPGTPFEAVEPFLADIDVLLIMTVEPGFGGQAFMEEMLPRIEKASAARTARKLSYRIEVDGGINGATAAQAILAGADTLVTGTSLFRAPDMAGAVAAMRGAQRAES